MKKIKLLIAITVIINHFLIQNATAQITELLPKNPKCGDSLQIVYNPQAKDAKLLSGDDVYVVYYSYSDGGSEQIWAPMNRNYDKFTHKLYIEKNVYYLTFYFITKEEWDNNATIATMVYNNEGVPVKGAYAQKITSPYFATDYEELFKKELELYPENYAAYRDKWFIESFDSEKKESIKKEINVLSKLENDSPEMFYSLSYGYSLLGNEEKSRRLILEMSKKHPRSYMLTRAIRSYEHQIFAQRIKGEGPEEIKKLSQNIVENYPNSDFARKKVNYFASKNIISLPLVEKICKSWMKDQIDNPEPYRILANAYYNKNYNLREASILIEKSVRFLLEGKLRFYEDVSGKTSKLYLPKYLYYQAQIYHLLKEYHKALSAITCAIQFSDESKPGFLLLEADIWIKYGFYSKAELAYMKAIKYGNEAARDSLKSVYHRRHLSEKGFDEYLSKLRASLTVKAKKDDVEIAPDFEITSIEGNIYKMSDLRGKVVVLNFWFTGCAPCRIEIPSLNKLVDDFQEQNVVFLAFSLDEKDALQKFLNKNPFRYKIIPNSSAISRKYKVHAYPSHVIVNRKGEIFYKASGGNENINKRLKTPIKEALK